MEVLGTQTILQVTVSGLLHGVPVVAATRFFPSTTCTYYCVLVKTAGPLLHKMCSIHPG